MQGRTNNTLDVRMGAMCRLVRLLCLATVGVGMANSSFALEFTADQITKIDGRAHKAFIYYRDQMWRIEHHSLGPVNVTIVRKDKQVIWRSRHA